MGKVGSRRFLGGDGSFSEGLGLWKCREWPPREAGTEGCRESGEAGLQRWSGTY